jgi:hypothetical protein
LGLSGVCALSASLNAYAATPLVHADEAGTAVARAVAAGFAASTLAPTTLGELRAADPVLLAGGTATVCTTGRATAAEVDEAVAMAEGFVLYGEREPARAALLDASRALLCAPDAPIVTGARIHYLSGALAQLDGDGELARTHFATAWNYDPEIG